MITWLALPVATTHTATDERAHPGESPRALATRLAARKACALDAAPDGAWVLGADTVVDMDGVSLGKPRSREEARALLARLRGRPHAVHTGVALHDPRTGSARVRSVTTRVHMRRYTDAEIEAYVASGDPMDKAGAYAIQHPGFAPVAHLDRCYANVVGLPLCAVRALLQAWDRPLPLDMLALCRRHLGYRCPAQDPGELQEVATCSA
jgi:MAF protein